MKRSILILAVILGDLHLALADAPWAAGVSPETQRAASTLFADGNQLFAQQAHAPALAKYKAAVELWDHPMIHFNLAVTLLRLDRILEAAAELESALRFGQAPFPIELYQQAQEYEKQIGRRVGAVEASCGQNGAQIQLDGTRWFSCPGTQKVRVMEGEHSLVGESKGFMSVFQRVVVHGGETVAVEVTFRPVDSSGRLRVEDERLVDADLFVDGTLLGKLPWEGALTPGLHYYSVRKGAIGSAPREVNIVAGQTARATVEAGPLGPALRVTVQPPTAALSIDSVPVGNGQWLGSLPLGRHTIQADEVGYFPRSLRLLIEDTSSPTLALRLAVDERHPRWGRPAGTFWAEGFGAYAFAASLHSAAEDFCSSGTCTGRTAPVGSTVGLRAGYALASGISFELDVGYLRLGTTVHREVPDEHTDPTSGVSVATRYRLRDQVRFSGPLILGGLGYRHRLASWLEVMGVGLFGVVFAATNDSITGEITGGGTTLPVDVKGSGTILDTAAPLVMPEIRFQVRRRNITLGVSVGLAWFPVGGPPHETGETVIVGADCAANPGTAHCAPTRRVVFEERAYGTFFLWLPSVDAGIRF